MRVSLLTALTFLLLGVALALGPATPRVYAQHDLSDDAKEHFNQGHEFYKKGRYDEAIAEFNKALEHDPKDAASLFGLGNSYFLKQNFGQAIKCYQEVVKIKPDFAKAHYALALAYRRLGRTEDAEKEFEVYNRLSTQKPAEAPKPAEPPKPVVAKPEPKKEVVEAPPPSERPVVKRLEPKEEEAPRPVAKPPEKIAVPAEKKKPVDEVLKKARPRESVSPERPLPKKEVRPAVTVIKKVKKEKGVIFRSIQTLKDWGPAGKVLLWLIYYTLAAQVWIGIVVLFGLIVLWRRPR
ncbi:MAG: tetratricopeptide repeat protein [Candidatus Brocadiales bacterium]